MEKKKTSLQDLTYNPLEWMKINEKIYLLANQPINEIDQANAAVIVAEAEAFLKQMPEDDQNRKRTEAVCSNLRRKLSITSE